MAFTQLEYLKSIDESLKKIANQKAATTQALVSNSNNFNLYLNGVLHQTFASSSDTVDINIYPA